jgi:hypothetical protein
MRETEVVRGVGVAEIKNDASNEDKNSEIALVPVDTDTKLPQWFATLWNSYPIRRKVRLEYPRGINTVKVAPVRDNAYSVEKLEKWAPTETAIFVVSHCLAI